MSNVDAYLKPPVERRLEPRRPCLLRGDLVTGAGRAEPIAVLDLTAEGARVAMRRSLLLPTRLILRVTLRDGFVDYDAELLWRRGLDAGFHIDGRREHAGWAH